MKKNTLIIISITIVVILILIIGGVIFWWFYPKEEAISPKEEAVGEEEEEEDGELKPPKAPTLSDPGETSASGSSFTVDWNKVTKAVSYTLERDLDSSFPNPIVIYAGENNSYLDAPSVKSTTTYYYRVRASNSVGDSPWSNVVDVKVTVGAPPTTPSTPILHDPGSLLSAGTSFSVSWSKPAGATYYVLQRDTNSSFSSPKKAYEGGKNNTIETLSPATTKTYYYRVKASNSAGSSSWSNGVDIEITVGAPPPITSPSAPTLNDPGESFDAGTSFGVSWSAEEGATSYKLERDDNSSFSSPSQAYKGSINYYSETLSPATTKTYYYRVKASNSAGSSSWSNVENVTINCLLPETPVLSDPGSSIAAGNSFQLTWPAVSGADSYTVEIDTDSSFSAPSSSQRTTSSKSITPAAVGTYYYRVKATNACGDSPWSNTVDITVGSLPDAPTLDDPGDIHPTNLAFTLTWSAVSDAISYTGEYDTNSSFSSPTSLTVGAVTSYSLTHTVAGTYYYRAKATNAFGDSPWSNTVDLQIIPFIIDVPDANQAPPDLLGVGYVGSFCTPMAAANVTEYWDVVQGDPNAVGVNIGLGEGYGPPWVVADYIGWFMNTNSLGSMDRWAPAVGTAITNIVPGLLDWIVWEGLNPTVFGFSAPALVAPAVGKTSYVSWSVKTTHSGDISQNQAWDDYCSEIDNGRPVIVDFDFWNPLPYGLTKGALDFYDWGEEKSGTWEEGIPEAPSDIEEEWYPGYPGEPETASGHTVTGVGYIDNYDPDGEGPIASQDWVIVHDNWDTTPINVAIPWQNWLANTYVRPLPNAAPEVPVIYDPGVSINQGTNYNVNWDKVSGASFYCYEWDTNSSFSGGIGACTIDGSITSFPGSNTPDSTTYYYRVQACNTYGCSDYSDTVDMEIIRVPATLSVPADYATIQAAINAAEAGDTVQIAAGTYQYSDDIEPESNLIIKGAGIDSTIIKVSGDRAIFLYNVSNVTISDLTIKDSGNLMHSEGAICILYGSDITIKNCKIIDNVAVNGAGIRIEYSSDILIENSIIASNRADNAGGAMSVSDSTLTMRNVTITDNVAGWSTGGVSVGGSSNVIVLNSIIWGNGDDVKVWGSATFSATYSDIGETISGTGNINQNPLFVGGGNYHLQGGSPCINAGNPAAQYNDTNGTRNDMGAYGGPGGS